MLTPSNIYKIDFEEECGGVKIPHTVIFNITQISEDEVKKLIRSDSWEYDNRVIDLRPKQLKYLHDKED